MKIKSNRNSAFTVSCNKGHEVHLDETEIEELIEEGASACEVCGESLSFPQEVNLECHICDAPFDADSLEEASSVLEFGCSACEERGFGTSSIHIRESFQWWRDCYHWMRDGRDAEPLTRKGRSDYWEGLVHFCHPEEFAAIFSDGCIRASSTGYFGVPAVCFTEATMANWHELAENHGKFGYVFRKRDLIEQGGAPAAYLPEPVILSIRDAGQRCDPVKPFVNLLRIPTASPGKKKYDYLHEREWRLPCDLMLNKIKPFSIVLGEFYTDTPCWQDIFKAAMKYQEPYLLEEDAQ